VSAENPPDSVKRRKRSAKRVPGQKRLSAGGRTADTAVVIAERRKEAAKLRVQGLGLLEIAERLGVSTSTAWSDIESVLDEWRCEAVADIGRLRQLEVAKLDELWHSLFSRAVDDRDEKAVDRLIRLAERRAKLLGLDAPVRSEVSGPDGGALQVDARSELLERITRLAAGSQPARREDAGEPDDG